MGRVCVLLLDSLGLGASHDAADYGDAGANTFLHTVLACRDSRQSTKGDIALPNLARRGIFHAAVASSATDKFDLTQLPPPEACYGFAVEQSNGKDTPSGHWELMGVPVMFDWGYFPERTPCFPEDLIQTLIKRADLPGVLGETHASGTTIIAELGEEHIKTGKPIVYTSADSVFQIAAHETHFGLDQLYELCLIARELVDDLNIGRVIARPFIGSPGAFQRTGNRRDYSVPPPAPTLFDHAKSAGREVIAVGKTDDIFAHQGTTKVVKADGNMALFDATLTVMKDVPDGSIVFTNFVDFDSSYGHRRDALGYAKALEDFDARLPALEALLKPGDLVVVTADHGCDPTFPGTDHTREHVPVLAFGPGIQGRFIGRRDSFADVGQSMAAHLGLDIVLDHGVSFL